MYYLYKITNLKSGSVYYGITNNIQQRWATHKHYAIKRKAKAPLPCAIRAYGPDNFSIEQVKEFNTREEAYEAEMDIIKFNKENDVKNYNLHQGGTGGFSIYEKSSEDVEKWRANQRVARVGKKPALGMKHTEENKKLFGQYGKLRWDIYGRYDIESIVKLRCIDAMRTYGISKTHYYRLKKQHKSNDLM